MQAFLFPLLVLAASVGVVYLTRRRVPFSLRREPLTGRSLRWWQAGLSMGMADPVAMHPFLMAALVSASGLYSLWGLWTWLLVPLVAAFLSGRGWRKAEVPDDAALFAVRYSGRSVRWLRMGKALLFGGVIALAVLILHLHAISLLAGVLLPWDLLLPESLQPLFAKLNLEQGLGAEALLPANATASLLVFALMTPLLLWPMGMHGLIRLQWLLLGLSVALGGIAMVQAMGGLTSLTPLVDKLAERYDHHRADLLLSFGAPPGEGVLHFLAGIGVLWLAPLFADGTGPVAQHCMACRSPRDSAFAALLGAMVFFVTRVVLMLPVVIWLMASGDMTVGREGVAALITGASVLSEGPSLWLLGWSSLLLLTGSMLAFLHWSAGYWCFELIPLMRGREPGQARMNPGSPKVYKVATLTLPLVATLFVLRGVEPFTLLGRLALLGGGLLPVFALRWIWERINAPAEWGGVLVALLLTLVLPAYMDVLHPFGNLLLFGVGLIVVVLLAAMTPLTRARVLDPFYRQVRPVGFWRHTATYSGHDPYKPMEEWVERQTAMIAAAATFFLLLIGYGKWLAPARHDPGMLPWLYVGLAGAAVPIWWRVLVKKPRRRGPQPPEGGFERLGE